ncbi:pyruvate phosphate dikinase [Gimesia maris DSM 8797]|uniref:Uncharacterized protein n=1 Tax=Gimesia maris TaxID=122 RepID=A0A3D3RC76_9PLAN|nr:pyruvate phosphate dikinase [Gimesia maris DSM 8797]MAC55722.1 hypothetical protein [Gimesia sp.]HCO25627.1 hypothetical protein [Gimesia maris]|tara:strand:+ start:89445 stop:89651 length:207 start_codon:yes stop_codon:yes gene_type:complete
MHISGARGSQQRIYRLLIVFPEKDQSLAVDIQLIRFGFNGFRICPGQSSRRANDWNPVRSTIGLQHIY